MTTHLLWHEVICAESLCVLKDEKITRNVEPDKDGKTAATGFDLTLFIVR
jgi:hypothetical protein